MLSPAELKKLHPRKRLAAFVPPSPREIPEGDEEDAEGTVAASKDGLSGLNKQGEDTDQRVDKADLDLPSKKARSKPVSATYVWGGLMRIDVVAAPASTALAFFSSGTMRVYSMPLLRADQKFELTDEEEAEEAASTSAADRQRKGGQATDAKAAEIASRASELVCSASVAARGGLVPHDLLVKPMMSGLGGVGVGGKSGALADIAVSGEADVVRSSGPGILI